MFDSIQSQIYKNYRLIISVDNEKTAGYVKENGITDYIFIIKDMNMPYPADSYFNILIAEAKEGFIWCVDDDDFIPHEKVLEIISQNVKPDMISIFKMQSNTIIPGPSVFGKSIQVCQIGTPCFVVPIEIAGRVKWRGESGSDYYYIKELTDKIGVDRINWVDEIIYKIDAPNQRGKEEI
jgi:glycosyltransferase involved in cell wall biosynthesis